MTPHPAGFRIVPLDAGYAAQRRATRRDMFGRPIEERRDAEPHQCRVCLELSAPGEPVLLLAHRPHPEGVVYAETGPLFIHARDCAPYADADRYPPRFPQRKVVLKAFSRAHEIVDARHALDARPEQVIAALFADPRVDYIHARNLGYGCFMFRIERDTPRAPDQVAT